MTGEKTLTQTGWIARQPDGTLILAPDKPFRWHNRWFAYLFIELKDYDPPLKWTDDPQKVEITIKELERWRRWD